MLKPQYTITEKNEHEGETYGYIMYLNPEEYKYIQGLINEQDEPTYSIVPTNYTYRDYTIVNELCDTSYTYRLSYRIFPTSIKGMDLDTLFYKGGVTEKSKMQGLTHPTQGHYAFGSITEVHEEGYYRVCCGEYEVEGETLLEAYRKLCEELTPETE